MPQREGHILEEPALTPPHLDLAPWNEQWRVHEPKEEHAGQIQTLPTHSKGQHVVVVCQPSHLSALHPPSRPIEYHPRAIDPRQRKPPARVTVYRADEQPDNNDVERENSHEQHGVLINKMLQVGGKHSCASNSQPIFVCAAPSGKR